MYTSAPVSGDGHAAGILSVHEFSGFGVYSSRNSPGVPSAVEA